MSNTYRRKYAPLSAVLMASLLWVGNLYGASQPDGDPLPKKPYEQGEMEVGAGLGAWGNSDYFSLSFSGSYAYYVLPGLAPGLDLQYAVAWGDLEYPQAFTVLPFIKYVLVRSYKFAPYLILTGGREFKWGGTTNPRLGYAPVDAWIFGGGIGAQFGLSPRVAMRLTLLALYYNFDETVLIADESSPVDSTVFFPLLSIGLVFAL